MKKNFFLIAAIILIVAGVVVSYLGNFALADISGFAVTMFGAGLAAATLWGKRDTAKKLWVSVVGLVLIGAGAFALGFLGFAENTMTMIISSVFGLVAIIAGLIITASKGKNDFYKKVDRI